MNAGNKCHLYENMLFASYSFSKICYFPMIAIFESAMRAMQSGWVTLLKAVKDLLDSNDRGFSFEGNCVLRRWESKTLK